MRRRRRGRRKRRALPMVNSKARSPVWGFQYGLEETCNVDKHITHEVEPAGEQTDRQTDG